jgi:hypothetical protein
MGNCGQKVLKMIRSCRCELVLVCSMPWVRLQFHRRNTSIVSTNFYTVMNENHVRIISPFYFCCMSLAYLRFCNHYLNLPYLYYSLNLFALSSIVIVIL